MAKQSARSSRHRTAPPTSEKQVVLKAVGAASDSLRARNALQDNEELFEVKQAEAALQRSRDRQELLAGTISTLLTAAEPQAVIEQLCNEIRAFLDCQVFFNFLLDPNVRRLRLNACGGVDPRLARKVEALELGASVCGTAARDACRVLAPNLSISSDPRSALVRSLGIRAYVCHPLLGPGNRVLGTLSFGAANRDNFSRDDLDLMETVTDHVAVALLRRESQQALRESDLKYRALFNSKLTGICYCQVVLDPAGRPIDYTFLDVNDVFSAMTGLPRDAVLGRTVTQVLPQIRQSPFDFIGVHGKVALTGEEARFETYEPDLQRWYSVFVFSPRKEYFVSIFTDVSDRKQAEERQEFLLQLSDCLRPLADPVQIQDEAARTLGEHLRADRVLYFEVSGDNYIVERDYAPSVPHLAGRFLIADFSPWLIAAYRNGQTVTVTDVQTDRHLSAEERRAYAAIHIQAHIGVPLVKKGQLVAGLAVHSSSTRAWSPAEVALVEETAERTWAAVERARAEASTARQNALLQGINRIFQEVLRSESEERLGQVCLDVAQHITASQFGFIGEIGNDGLLHDIAISNPGWDACTIPTGSPRGQRLPAAFKIHGIYGRVILNGKGYFTNDPASHPDRVGFPAGHPALEAFLGVPLTRENRIIGMIAVGNREGGYGLEQLATLESLAPTVVEAFERRRAEEALRQSEQRLERLVAERTAKLQELVGELEHFSYTIVHDMRAPLRAMRGFAELLDDLCVDDPRDQRKEFARKIMTSAERMDSLITDALSYSRAVRQELPLEKVDTGALLRGMLDSYPELQPSRANIQLDGPLPVVLGNQAGLTQCFSNLLGNAVKFVHPGKMPEIRVWAEPHDGRVRIWVEDRGIGIPESMLPRVFDMFSRGSQKYPGTGIGLALVRKVAQRMGGKTGVDSLEGSGSRFWLELQLADTEG